MQIVAIIPSRYGSSRFAGKPLALIGGKPMIQRVYEKTALSSIVDGVYVATDDQRIYDAVIGFGGDALMTGAGNRSGTDRVAEAARILGLGPQSIVVNVQGDQPLLDPRCIDQLVAPVCSGQDVPMSTLAVRIVNPREITDPKDVKVTFDNCGTALYFSRSTIPYARNYAESCEIYKHLGLYAYRKRFLDVFSGLPSGKLETTEKLEQLRAMEFGYPIRVVVTDYDSPEVDLPEDIQRIEKILATR